MHSHAEDLRISEGRADPGLDGEEQTREVDADKEVKDKDIINELHFDESEIVQMAS